jgi:hypothetical protein
VQLLDDSDVSVDGSSDPHTFDSGNLSHGAISRFLEDL